MATVLVRDPAGNEVVQNVATVAPSSLVALAAGITAAWFAAGSTGFLGHPLQHALTWFALGVAFVAVWPRNDRSFTTWAILAVSVGVGLLCTVSPLPTINILAVVIVLAAIAQIHRGLAGRVTLIAAFAAGSLALYHFACDSIPTVWLLANCKGWILGKIVGWLAGRPLEVGATFAGLDFLVLMTALCVGWLICTVPPRRSRAIWAIVAIAVGHLIYLFVLANSESLLAALPDLVVPPESDINYVGIWTLGNGLRTLIPWNLPLLDVVIQCAIAVLMFRWAVWLPVIEPDAKELKKQQEKEAKEDIPGSVLAADMLFRFGPALFAVLATLLVALNVNQSDLNGKNIVAYGKGYLNWIKPEYDATAEGFYGMLPTFVESLGGKFNLSKDLAEKDLANADVLVVLHPDEPWSEELLQRVWQYVARGGSLLVVADTTVHENKSHSSFNELLQPTAMRVCYDTVTPRSENWEHAYQVLTHPITDGLDDSQNRFGFDQSASIRTHWPARPIVSGRWGWDQPGSDATANSNSAFYSDGDRLGDLVLAAEQSVGNGRVVVLGGTAPLRNEMLANAFPFVGRTLGYLANRPANSQALWRQLLGLVVLLAMVLLLVQRPAAWQLMATPAVLAIALASCTATGYWSGRVLPDGRARVPKTFNNIAYIDASHLNAYSNQLWANHGIAGLLRTLMRQGYLPLLAPDLSQERLDRAGLLISIAPARQFTAGERDAVSTFVHNGGTFICMVGAEDVRPIAPLLADFKIQLPPSPIPIGQEVCRIAPLSHTRPDSELDKPNPIDDREPDPLGAMNPQVFGSAKNRKHVQFYAGWPVRSESEHAENLVTWCDDREEYPIVVSSTEQGGSFVVIADTHFASNENLETSEGFATDNVYFWRWLLGRVVPRQQPWDPAGGKTDSTKAGSATGKSSPKTSAKSPITTDDDADDMDEDDTQ